MLSDLYTEKQLEVLKTSINERPRIIACSGAKRAGKTFVLIQAFVLHMREFANKGVKFIIGGASIATIQRNVLDDLEKLLNIEIKLDKKSSFEVWGNTVYCFGGANSDSWKSARGFTSAGAFLNEGTALHDSFVKEVISRCSYEGARIFIDTNPENPLHPVKTDYIDKNNTYLSSGKLNVKAFHFTLYDNNFLPKEYIESIEMITPSGMYFDRDIKGLWVTAEGIVYKDFNIEKHVIKKLPENTEFIRYIGGVDWGHEHYGSIVVLGVTEDNTYYLLEEIAEQHKFVNEFWIPEMLRLQEMYRNIIFYADHARPDYIDLSLQSNVCIDKANKSVQEGIGLVGSLLKRDKIFFLEDKFKKGKEEMMLYSWQTVTLNGDDKVIKLNDDVLDGIRYAIYTDSKEYNNTDIFLANY